MTLIELLDPVLPLVELHGISSSSILLNVSFLPYLALILMFQVNLETGSAANTSK